MMKSVSKTSTRQKYDDGKVIKLINFVKLASGELLLLLNWLVVNWCKLKMMMMTKMMKRFEFVL